MKKFAILLFGLLFIGVGVFMYFKNAYLVKNCTVEAVATVVDMEEELDTDSEGYSRYMYYPVVEYLAGTEQVETKMDSGSSTPAYRIGDKVTILYNPNKTNEFIVKGENTMSIFSIVFGIIGLCIAGYGIKVAISKES